MPAVRVVVPVGSRMVAHGVACLVWFWWCLLTHMVPRLYHNMGTFRYPILVGNIDAPWICIRMHQTCTPHQFNCTASNIAIVTVALQYSTETVALLEQHQHDGRGDGVVVRYGTSIPVLYCTVLVSWIQGRSQTQTPLRHRRPRHTRHSVVSPQTVHSQWPFLPPIEISECLRATTHRTQ